LTKKLKVIELGASALGYTPTNVNALQCAVKTSYMLQ